MGGLKAKSFSQILLTCLTMFSSSQKSSINFKVGNADNWLTCCSSLIEGPSQIAWKVLAGCILAPLQFLPMNWLGFTSFLGIFCNLVIIVVAVVVGVIKMHSPGSLREVAATYAFPPQWKALPLSFGLIMGEQYKITTKDTSNIFVQHYGAATVSFQTSTVICAIQPNTQRV